MNLLETVAIVERIIAYACNATGDHDAGKADAIRECPQADARNALANHYALKAGASTERIRIDTCNGQSFISIRYKYVGIGASAYSGYGVALVLFVQCELETFGICGGGIIHLFDIAAICTFSVNVVMAESGNILALYLTAVTVSLLCSILKAGRRFCYFPLSKFVDVFGRVVVLSAAGTERGQSTKRRNC